MLIISCDFEFLSFIFSSSLAQMLSINSFLFSISYIYIFVFFFLYLYVICCQIEIVHFTFKKLYLTNSWMINDIAKKHNNNNYYTESNAEMDAHQFITHCYRFSFNDFEIRWIFKMVNDSIVFHVLANYFIVSQNRDREFNSIYCHSSIVDC